MSPKKDTTPESDESVDSDLQTTTKATTKDPKTGRPYWSPNGGETPA